MESLCVGGNGYLDAGSIVALGAGLALFQEYLNLSNSAVGLLAAIDPTPYRLLPSALLLAEGWATNGAVNAFIK